MMDDGDAAKKVVVTSAQKRAAAAMVKRAAATGRQVSKAVHKIANAKTVGRMERSDDERPYAL